MTDLLLWLASLLGGCPGDHHRLGDDDFEVREAASSRLAGAGWLGVPALLRAAEGRDPESRMRAERLLAGRRIAPPWKLAAWWLLCGPEDVSHEEVRWLLDHPQALGALADAARRRDLWQGPMVWECDFAWFPPDEAVALGLRRLRVRLRRLP